MHHNLHPKSPLGTAIMPALHTERRRYTARHPRPLSSGVNISVSPRRKYLTYHDKLSILDFRQLNPHLTQSDIAQHLCARFPFITQSAISRYVTQEKELRDYAAKFPQRLTYTRELAVYLPTVDAALTQWVTEKLDHGRVHLTGPLLCEKARQFAQLLGVPDNQLKFSDGWLDSFKQRMGLHRV